jgi:hypothetical protein
MLFCNHASCLPLPDFLANAWSREHNQKYGRIDQANHGAANNLRYLKDAWIARALARTLFL